ncbi:MAG TPA: TetR/AcrR family transcriptional regulator C-terminal domain-containing protein [Devosiaceae bacterium]|jgi:TetR/AcrR family tetracycline transcriptional repressor
MALTRQDVIDAALRLLDAEGLDRLTLRRLAKELGISAPTLYWHVRDKRQLLDLMAEAMVVKEARRSPLPETAEWWQRVEAQMRRRYQAMITYRDGPRVVAGNRPTEAMLPHIDRMLELWTKAGFPPGEALVTIWSFGNFIIGSALEHQAELERMEAAVAAGRERRNFDELPYPTLRDAVTAVRGQQRISSFERGLALMIAGLRQRQAELLAEKAKAGQPPGLTE